MEGQGVDLFTHYEWPAYLSSLEPRDPKHDEDVLVAEICANVGGTDDESWILTALVPEDEVDSMLSQVFEPGELDGATGPHPDQPSEKWDYQPRYWVNAPPSARELESLTWMWSSGGRQALLPDQGFLLTYGLIPRYLEQPDRPSEVHWDDPGGPMHSVIRAVTAGESSWDSTDRPFITVIRDYLKDYATIRKRALVQVFHVGRWVPKDDRLSELLAGGEYAEYRSPGRFAEIRTEPVWSNRAFIRIWGARELLRPGPAPITQGRWDYGTLVWPGIPKPVTRDVARSLRPLDHQAFVSDSVLALYEGRPGYEIFPESGSVRYGHEWSVTDTSRLGRDLIEVSLRKLYEGARPETVQVWHDHSVSPPHRSPVELRELRAEPNIARRVRRIMYAVLSLGQGLAEHASTTLNEQLSTSDLVAIDAQELEYNGWWKKEYAEKAARHAPLSMTEGQFISRASDLYKLAVEGLSERRLRHTLVKMGVDSNSIHDWSDWRSIRLLDFLVSIAVEANVAGLGLPDDSTAVLRRFGKPAPGRRLSLLALLNELRQVDAHRASDQRVDKALASLKLNRASVASGWGVAADILCDRLAEELEGAAVEISNSINGRRPER